MRRGNGDVSLDLGFPVGTPLHRVPGLERPLDGALAAVPAIGILVAFKGRRQFRGRAHLTDASLQGDGDQRIRQSSGGSVRDLVQFQYARGFAQNACLVA